MTLGNRLLVWRILNEGERRGPATEAATLYEDLSPPPLPRAEKPVALAERDPGSGRPTKKERRDTDRLQDWRRRVGTEMAFCNRRAVRQFWALPRPCPNAANALAPPLREASLPRARVAPPAPDLLA